MRKNSASDSLAIFGATAMSEKPWMAIVSFPHPGGTKPHVIMREGLDEPATFRSPKHVEKLMMKHLLIAGVWHAFNFETGEIECLG